MNKRFQIIILLFSWIYTNNPVFVGEELQYSAGFRFLSAGEAILSFSADSIERIYLERSCHPVWRRHLKTQRRERLRRSGDFVCGGIPIKLFFLNARNCYI